MLRYLQWYKTKADEKCEEAILQARAVLGDEKFAGINSTNKTEFVEKLCSFIDVRINYILNFPNLRIPLKQLVESLHMTNDQIKSLTSSKMNNSQITLSIEKTQSMIMKGQLCDIFNQNMV